jgi:hypothetical protein
MKVLKQVLAAVTITGLLSLGTAGVFAQKGNDNRPPKESQKVKEKEKPPPSNSNSQGNKNRGKP